MSRASSSVSPFEIGLGQFGDAIEIPLGGAMGLLKIWRHGKLDIWGEGADPLERPALTLDASHVELLRQLANELERGAAENQTNQPTEPAQDVEGSKQTAEPSTGRSEPVRAMPAAILMKNGNTNGHQRALELAGD